jgi:aminopeptidase-like protein
VATGDEHFMHLLQAGSSVKDAGVRRQIEQRVVLFLDAESHTVDFSAPADVEVEVEEVVEDTKEEAAE